MKNNRLVEMTYTRLKLGAIAMLVGALLMGQMPTIDAKSPKHCPINIGYPNGISPIPLTPDCLFPIVIPGRTTTIHSGSVAEPTIAVNPKDCDRIVACWQQSRIFNGGSLEVGIAYSKNKGKSWKRTTVPLQICNGGINTRVSDVWLSYSADGKVLYLSALTLNSLQDTNTQNQMAVISSISKDNGKHWSAPSFLYASAEYLSEPDGI
ncbi:MAG: sialidase family protein, partial [Parachlamydiaceae bacterium]